MSKIPQSIPQSKSLKKGKIIPLYKKKILEMHEFSKEILTIY